MHPDLEELYRRRFGSAPSAAVAIRPHASGRALYRLTAGGHSVIGVVYDAVAENRAFIEFARHFRSYGLAVPEIYAVAADGRSYLEEDLGDETLYDRLLAVRSDADPFPSEIEALYRGVLEDLIEFQAGAGPEVDYGYCYQGSVYDQHAMQGDVAYFEQQFLGRLAVGNAKRGVSEELSGLVRFLAEAPHHYFMFRDFQARNIMMRGEVPHYIDFQSGRRGALQYDLVSLLFQSQAKIPECARERLLGHYLWRFKNRYGAVPPDFRSFYRGFAVLRLLQVLGAYGSLGLGAGKEYFRQGIPLALATLREAAIQPELPVKLSVLPELIDRLLELPAV